MRVKCIDAEGSDNRLICGRVYEVVDEDNDGRGYFRLCGVGDDSTWWLKSRFEILPDKPVDKLKFTVSITDIPLWQDVIKLVKDMLADDRAPQGFVKEYREKINNLVEGEVNE